MSDLTPEISADSSVPRTLRLGTRGSMLARMQSQWVADELEKRFPDLRVELIVIKTSGDQIVDRPLHEVGGKGLFTKELEQALLDRQVNFAVHSFKDVPTTMPLVEQSQLVIAAVPAREDARDVLVAGRPMTIEELPQGAKVGTGSLRRRCQLLSWRPDLQIEPVRGNIDTRLRKQREGQFDAIVLAAAGLRRTGLFDSTNMSLIDPLALLPAPGQGALALQCREDDATTRGFLSFLTDDETAQCVAAERALVKLLRGDCTSPIAAYATIEAGEIVLKAAVGARSGNPPVLRVLARGDDPKSAANEVYYILVQQHVESLLFG